MSSFQPSPSDPNAPLHPYYPLDAPIPNWTPNTLTLPFLLTIFTATTTTLLTLTTLLSLHLNPTLTNPNLLTTLWFAFSGLCHLLFESHYLLHPTTLASRTDLLSQLWKEYALSDSRYLTASPLVFSLESFTVTLWGPLCLLTAACIVKASAWRWPLQIIVGMAHMYGDGIYYATSLGEAWGGGVEYCRPEGMYFWGYFVGMNALWVVVPGWLIWQSCNEIVQTFGQVEKGEEGERKRK